MTGQFQEDVFEARVLGAEVGHVDAMIGQAADDADQIFGVGHPPNTRTTQKKTCRLIFVLFGACRAEAWAKAGVSWATKIFSDSLKYVPILTRI